MSDDLKGLRMDMDALMYEIKRLSKQASRLEERLDLLAKGALLSPENTPESVADVPPVRSTPPPIPVAPSPYTPPDLQPPEQQFTTAPGGVSEKIAGGFQQIADQLSDSTPIGEPPPKAKPKSLNLENLESLIGENFFNKLGVVTIVIGLALAMMYGFTHMGPWLKILTGLVLSGAGIGAGAYYERREKWRLYARGVIGGGWALLYFTVFASHHIKSVQLVDSPTAGIILLLSVAIGIIAHSLKYRSQTITGIAYLLGFFTMTLTPLRAFSLGATMALAVSLVLTQWRLKWHFLGMLGVAAVYWNFNLWLHPALQIIRSEAAPIDSLGWPAAILIVYWSLFTISHFIVHGDERVQASVMTANAGAFYMLFHSLLKETGNLDHLWKLSAYLGLAYIAVLILATLYNFERVQVFAAAIAGILIAVAIPQKLSGPGVAIGWLMVGQIALIASIVRRREWYSIIGWAYFLAAFVHLLGIEAVDKTVIESAATHYFKHMPAMVFAVVLYFANGYWLDRANKVESSRLKLTTSFILFVMGIVTALTLARNDLNHDATTAVAAALSVAVIMAGSLMERTDLRIQGTVLSALAGLVYLAEGSIGYGLLTSAAIIVGDRLNIHFAKKDDLNKNTVYLLQGGTLPLIGILAALMMLSYRWLDNYDVLLYEQMLGAVWGALGLAFFLVSIYTYEARYRFAAYFLCVAGFITIFEFHEPLPNALVAVPLLAIYALSYIGFPDHKIPDDELKGRWLLADCAGFIGCIVFYRWVEHGYLTVSWAGVSFVMMAIGMVFRDRNVRLSSLGLFGLCILKVFFVDLRGLETLARILSFVGLGAILLLVSYIYTHYKKALEKYL